MGLSVVTDSSGNFWLFGGNGYDSTGNTANLNDLWMFNPTNKTWTWVSGSNTIPANGVVSPANGFKWACMVHRAFPRLSMSLEQETVLPVGAIRMAISGSSAAMAMIQSARLRHGWTGLGLNDLWDFRQFTGTLSSITVAPANTAILAGRSQQFTATGTYSDSSTQNLTGTVSWTSSNTSVATVNSTGVVTAVAAGSTYISASLNGVSSNTVVLGVVSGAYTAPTETVGTASGTQTATILFSSSFTLGSISVVTQGATGLDFNYASGGTCAVELPTRQGRYAR